jgi:PAS domain-containing protein
MPDKGLRSHLNAVRNNSFEGCQSMATNAGLIGVLKHLAEACEARNFNIHLELDGLSAEEQEATRLLVRAINDYQAAVESEQNSKLKEAFGRAKVVTEASPNGLTLWDRDCNLFDCNEAYVRLFKLKNLQEFLERHRELSPEYQPDGWLSGDKICAMVKKAFAEGTCEFEWTHQTSDGALIPCHVKMVRVAYEDDYVVVGYLRDLREQKAMMSEIARKGALVSMANQVAGILLESDVVDFNDTVQRCLKMMGETVNADRASIWVNSVKDGRLYCTQIHEWLGNAESQINKDITREVSYDDVISGWEATLSSGRCINALVRDMPAVIQEQVKQQNILSLCVVPIFVQGHFWGYMGFDHCHRERVLYEVEEDVLRSCGSGRSAAGHQPHGHRQGRPRSGDRPHGGGAEHRHDRQA